MNGTEAITIRISPDGETVDWQAVAAILKSVGMAHYPPEVHARAFAASHTTVFAYHGRQLVGFGRAISDGTYQAAVYDCAVDKAYQGKGLGRRIVEAILSRLDQCNVILYASPGKEGFYQKHGFRKMKTGMARFIHAERMQQHGFVK